MNFNNKYVKLFIGFVIIFFIVFMCIHFLSKGYTNEYKVGNSLVKEVYIKDKNNEHNNYYIEIKYNDIIYPYQIYNEIEDDNKIVKDIIYFDSDYECLLPILSDNLKVDFMCYKDSKYYNYIDIKGKDEKLDKSIKKLDKDIYNINIFLDNKKNKIKKDNYIYYKNNIPNEYFISLTTLKGIITFKDKVDIINIFKKDVYKRELSIFYENYYICVDYSKKYQFDEIYIINMKTGEKKILKTPDYISFDSYIQGIVDNKLYLYDLDNEKQYEIDIKNSKIQRVGSNNKGIKYYDGNWSSISVIKANNKLLFKNSKETITNDSYTYKQGNKLSGFYYYFLKKDNSYEVYKANVQSPHLKKYIFTVEDYNDVQFIEDYAFYKKGDSIMLYNDYVGTKTLINDSELEFNKNILFNVYKD